VPTQMFGEGLAMCWNNPVRVELSAFVKQVAEELKLRYGMVLYSCFYVKYCCYTWMTGRMGIDDKNEKW